MSCHSLCVAVPLCGVLLDCDKARLHVMYIIAKMLMQCERNGSINFVCFHNLLHWDVTMLLGRQGVALGGELCQATADAESRIARLDDIVDIAVLGCLVWVGE